MPRRRKGRDVTGIILLDKPAGMTSNRALQRVRHCLEARKAGHTGSLDPLATGLLPLCFGEATKVSGFLLEADKRYRVCARFGVRTDSGDADGTVVERVGDVVLDPNAVRSACTRFSGDIEQIPPMYSALKHKGERLYRIARAGGEVARAPRAVRIHALDVVTIAGTAVTFDVHCSKGTYIRTLVEDIGQEIGVCAHVETLRRTALGPFGEGGSLTPMQAVEAAAGEGSVAVERFLQPTDLALVGWPAVALTRDMAHYVRQGQAVWVPSTPPSAWYRLYDADGMFMGMGTGLSDGRIAPRRMMSR